MYLFYGTILVILLSILIVIYKEERRLRFGVSYGKIDRYLILKERRRYIRFNEEVPVHYKTIQNSSAAFHGGITKDLSKAGLGMVIDERLNIEEILDINFKVPDFDRPIKVIGRVVWIKEIKDKESNSQEKRTFRVGISFRKIDPESETLLVLYLNKLKQRK